MFKFDLRFVRVRNKLTGFSLTLETPKKTVNFEFSLANMPKFVTLPVCSNYKRYTSLNKPSDVDMLGYFSEFSDMIRN